MKLRQLLSKNNIKQILTNNYLKYYKKYNVDEKIILLEAKHGEDINGSIYYLLKELYKNYKEYKLFVVVKDKSIGRIKKLLTNHNIKDGITFIKYKRAEYYKALAQAKYLINDTSFHKSFIKKPEQIYFNTWHGTPLKTLGKKVKNDELSFGNIQRNFLMADYLLYPNEFMMKHMIEDYMLENICKARILLTGYPRNTAFFDNEKRDEIRKKLKLEKKEIFFYMPTWRGKVNEVEKEKQIDELSSFLIEIDGKLTEEQVLYVSLHPFVKEGINYNQFKRIKPLLNEYETYEFLNISDCLITDYSSSFFDYSITKRKIILFAYDEEEYLRDRGMYLSLEEMPFPKVKDVKSLIKEMNSKQTVDYTNFIEKFAKYEAKDVCEQLCKKIIKNEKTNIEELKMPNNNKENVLIYVGNLAKNGITSSIQNLLKNINLEKRNYFITFDISKVGQDSRGEILNFPERVNYIPMMGRTNISKMQRVMLSLFWLNRIDIKVLFKYLKDVYKYEIKRLYGNANFSNIIQFNGYDSDKILLFSEFEGDKIIYVHNDMEREVNSKGTQHKNTLKYAYDKYDKIALVTEDLIEPTKYFTSNLDKFYISKNIIDYKGILEKSNKNIEFDEQTECNISKERLEEILNNKEYKKFINIGRFSAEKGHIRLINAFNKLYLENNKLYLIIIGGYGVKYEETLNYANSVKGKDNIVIIKYMNNPYTILNKSDYFVLSSLYEGFGIVVAEADLLGKPLVATDIIGPRGFIKKHKGQIVENSEEGILNGMQLLLDGKIKPMNIDFEEYNKEAVEEFEKLFEKNNNTNI